jgi:hypothetical protein
MKKKFRAKLTGHGPKAAWIFFDVPFDVAKIFGTKARVPVVGALNGVPFQNSLMPNGDDTHSMHVTKVLMAKAGAKTGDTVAVVLERDETMRTVTPPADLLVALAAQPHLEKTFLQFSYSHQKELVDWMVAAKKPETRERRIQKALAMLAEKTTLKKAVAKN